MHSYSAEIFIIGVNPYVDVPEDVLQAIFEQSSKSRGPIPVRGNLDGHPFIQTLVRYQGAWRLYLNTPMRQAAGIDVGDTAHVELEFDPDPRITPIPPQFAQALAADPKTRAAYDKLTPGRQKEILRYLGNLKSEESLTRNIERVLAHLQGKDPDALHALMRHGTAAQARARQAKSAEQPTTARKPLMPLDAIDLTVFSSLFSSVAEEMGVTLCRAAYSPNIKERRDYSCALFDDQGRLVAQAAHIPVHLGSMPEAVRVALERVTFVPDDLVIFNDPYLGGTHLPDVTMVSAVFFGDDLVGYVASRAHQADIGGMSPGSMPLSTELYQEGIIIPPVKLLSAGQVNQPLLDLIYRNVRTPAERAGDFAAQMAAHRTGETRLIDLVRRYSLPKVREAMSAVMDYSESVTRAALLAIPAGVMTFDDQLDDDGIDPSPISMRVTVTIADGGLTADFTGCASERRGSINAVRAVTLSAVYYVVRCLVGEDVPVNDGCFRPVHVITPEDTVVNPRPPRAVAAGNVETSQRIVDLLLGALASALPDRIPAASNGSMNNVTIGGVDPSGRPFAYYETIGGGTGAGPTSDGLSAVHSHMTNTQNTPVESLEFAYPFRVRDYGVATGTGGGGKHTGGDGIRRVYEFLCPATVTIVSERRVSQPYGLSGGQPGASGVNQLRRKNGEWQPLPAKTRIEVEAGDQVSITTPGGGGWGKATG